MASKRPKKKPTLERSIYFYRIDAGSIGGKPKALDLSPYVSQVRSLVFEQDSRRYWSQDGGDPIGLWTDDDSGLDDRFALATVRRSALPRAESNGSLSALRLGVGGGLHEPIHVRLFDHNIIGVEFNFYGPRITRLSDYLSHALDGGTARFKLEALLKQDVLNNLNKQGQIRLLDLQIRSSYAAQLSEAAHGKLGAVLKQSSQLPGVPVVGVVLRPEPHKRDFLGKSVLESVKSIAGMPGIQTNAAKFLVKGENEETGDIDTLDLLQDKLVSRRSIVSIGRNSRAIDPHSAYEAIGDAYAELEEQLLTAAGASVTVDD